MVPQRLPHERDEAGWEQAVERVRDAIITRRLFQPQIALILGSGLGDLADRVEHAVQIPYDSLPHFPCTFAAGHRGQLVLGYLAGLPVVIMQGRSHRYEGFSNLEISFPVLCMRALGAHTLITTNAAGGLNARFQTGDLMVLDSHLDFLWTRRQPTLGRSHPAPPGPNPYDFTLIAQVKSIARRHDIQLHQGCYLATLGPTYETRSEYRWFRQTGADAVGMSTVPEVLAAQATGMRVLAFSVITNVASTDIPVSTTHQEVIDSGHLAGPRLMAVIEDLLGDMAGQPD